MVHRVLWGPYKKYSKKHLHLLVHYENVIDEDKETPLPVRNDQNVQQGWVIEQP